MIDKKFEKYKKNSLEYAKNIERVFYIASKEIKDTKNILELIIILKNIDKKFENIIKKFNGDKKCQDKHLLR